MRTLSAKATYGSVCLALTIGAVVGPVSSAHAWLKICNQTTKTVQYEHSVPDNSCEFGYRDKGWWIMTPGQCKTVYSGSMNNKDFFYYAEATDLSLIWEGDFGGWPVPYAAFDQCGGIGVTPCTAPAGERCLYHRRKTGTATNYTLNLVQ